MPLPPGSQLPPARQTARWLNRPLEFLQQLQAEHGDIFTVRTLSDDPFVMVSDPELVERIFTADPRVLHAGEGNRHLAPIFGTQSIFLLDEREHMRQRKLLLPPFRGRRLEAYEESMREAVEEQLDHWPRGVSAPVRPRLHTIALEAILRALFGIAEVERLDPLRDALNGLLEYTSRRSRTAFVAVANPDHAASSRLRGPYEALARVRGLLLEDLMQIRGDGGRGETREDVRSLLMRARYDDGSPLSDDEIVDQLMTLLMAGHETTATALAWALERLARHRQALEQVSAEADRGGRSYTEATIKETLRIRPVVPFVPRRVKEPFELGGYVLPPGTTVWANILLLHRRPDVYPEPEAFRPERFLGHPSSAYTWVPFGGGTRYCLGAGFALMEMRVVLSTLLARAEPWPPDAEPEAAVRRLVTLSPAKGARLALEPRRPRLQRDEQLSEAEAL